MKTAITWFEIGIVKVGGMPGKLNPAANASAVL